MLKGLRLPTHRVDAPGVFVFGHDDAWDHEHIRRECDDLALAGAAESPDELPFERHPVMRYLAGKTRFDLQAFDQGPHGQVRAADYLRDDERPTYFVLRRVGYRERLAIGIERNPVTQWTRWVQAGVARIVEGERVLWAAEAQEAMPEAMLEAIADAAGGPRVNLITLAGACARYSAPLDDAEKKA